MAVPSWAQRYFDEDKKRQEQQPMLNAQINIDQADQTARNRRIVDGIDPALANVKESFPSKLKRLGGQIPLGILEGANELNKNFGINADVSRIGLDPQLTKSDKPMISDSDFASMNKGIGTKGTTPENVIRGLGEFIPSLTLGGGLNKFAGVTKAAQESGALYKGMIGNKLAGKAAETVTKQLPDMTTTWMLMEGQKPEAERTPLPIWAAQWVGSDLALRGVAKGIGAGIGKLKGLPEIDDPFAGVVQEFKPMGVKAEPVQSPTLNANLPFMPAGYKAPNQLLRGMQKDWKAPLPEVKPPMPRPASLNRNVDIAGLPDRYPLPNVKPKEILAKAYDNRNNLNGKLPTVKPINMELQNKITPNIKEYDKLINEEVKRLRSEGGQGVIQSGLGFNPEGEVVTRWGRQSLNPKWYQELYKANISEKYPGGRPPTAEQLRQVAIENLRNGVETVDGEIIPPNISFLKIEKQNQLGRTIPDEWATLEGNIKEMQGNRDYSQTEIKPLIDEMKIEQTKLAQPEYKISIESLDKAMQEAKQRITTRNKTYKPGTQNIVARDPMEDIKDLSIIGAAKLAKTGIKWSVWSKEMLAEYGAEIEPNLPYIWQRSQELLSKGATTIKIGGQELPVTLQNAQGKGNVSGDNWNHVATKTTAPKVTAKSAANSVYSAAFDDLNRLKQVDKEAYTQALNSREAGGIANTIVTKALVDSRGNTIGESLKSITKQIPKKLANDFDNYLIYRHAPSWLEQGRKVFPESEGITADIARQRATAYEQAHPEFKALGDRIIKWQRDLGKAWFVDTGIVKPEAWAKMQEMYPDYIPFQRKMQDIEVMAGSGKAKGGFANQSNPLKKAEGSQREIISPIESMIEHVEKYVKTAKRNEVMQTVYGNIKQSPESLKPFIEIMPEKGETFESVFAKDGMDGFIQWMEEPFEQLKAIKNVSYDKPNIVRGIVNGETVHFKVNDPVLLNSLTSLSQQGANAVIEFFRQGTRIMKVLTTGGNPIFATRNIARDLPMAYISSDTLAKTPILREVQFAWGILDSFARIVTGGKYDPGSYYKTFKAMGGGSHSSSMAADRNLLAESKAAVMPGYYDIKKPVASLGRGLKATGRGIEKFTNAVETLPRLPEYVRTVKKGGDTYASRQQGLFNAQDVTVNFSKRGSISKDADAFIPYLNAALQGIDKIGRVYSQNPAQAVYRSVVAVSVPAITLWQINHDNPNYKKLSSWTKDNYFCIPLPDGKFFKIAKPREVGVVFGSLIERTLSKWQDDDPNGFKYFSEAWINNFAPPARTIAAPFTDVIANKNFVGAPIVPGYMEKLSPRLQFDESTSAPAKAVGNLLNVSPKKADYLARSYTGVLGELGIPAASTGRGESSTQRVGNVLNKTFTADPLYSNDTLTTFYELKGKLDNANSDFKATKAKSNDYSIGKSKVVNNAADRIGDINKQIRAINGNQSIPYKEKDQRVRELKQKALDIAQQALSRTENIK